MTKLIKKETLQSIHQDLDGSTLAEAITFLQGFQESYEEDTLKLSWTSEWSDEYYKLYIVHERLETDEEYQQRLDQEAKWANDKEARDRKLFEELKAKFG
jgi:hypothetical protein